jgi:hypothetical protein
LPLSKRHKLESDHIIHLIFSDEETLRASNMAMVCAVKLELAD